MKFPDAINELKDTFHSIDVRIFSFKQDNVWKNVFTIIRFRRETEDKLKAIHEKIIKQCRKLIQTDEFRVGVFHFPIERWDKICKDLTNKFICLTDTYAVNYFDVISFNETTAEPHVEHLNFVDRGWKFFIGYSETRSSSRPSYHDKLLDSALENNFSHIDDYLSAILQFDTYDFNRSPWLKIFVPTYFKTEKITFEHDKVEIKYSAYEQKDIQISFNFYKSSLRRTKEEFVDQKFQNLKLKNKADIIHDKTIIELDANKVGNSFELLVIKNNKLVIEQQEGKISDYWKGRSEYTNPLYFAFEKFVDYENLENMLFEFKSKGIGNQSDVFERGVSWLLSLLRIPNIMLGKYEKIGEGFNIISADILGVLDENRLFLVNATIGLPKQSDFDRERDYRENLEKMLTNKNLKISSLYFTGKEPTESEKSATTNNVILIGKSKLKIILQHLKKGELEDALNIVINEDFYMR